MAVSQRWVEKIEILQTQIPNFHFQVQYGALPKEDLWKICGKLHL